MKFKEVASFFEQIEKVSSRITMTTLLADLFKKATPKEAHILTHFALGQLRAPHEGTQFNVAEKSLIKVLAIYLKKPEDEVKKTAKKLGDLGEVVVAHRKRTPQDELTLTQVYRQLSAFEKVTGTGSQEKRAQLLLSLLCDLAPRSAKYVVRMVAGKLRLGFSDMTIVDALSWLLAGDKSLRKNIENAYNICADLGLIAQRIKEDGLAAIEHMHSEVGTPIRLAAAERLPTARAIVKKIGPCVAQPKLDGFRLQMHLDKTKSQPVIKFFSRNLQDMSAMFPDIKAAFTRLPVKQLICEGEAIVYNPETGNFLPFQETVKRKRKHGIEEVVSELPLRVFLFDLLYLDGADWLDKTHAQRRTKLLSIGKKIKDDRIQIIEEQPIKTAKDLEDYFTANIAAGLEGLVVKKPDAVYQPGKRNFNWIKLKRQEEGHLEDTLDCVVLGYYTGKGKRAHFGIGAFLVGVYNKRSDAFETIAKIGTGLKDHEWKELKQECDDLEVANKPRSVVCHKDLVPDVWIAPDIVCLIRADEITLSPVHSAGKTTKKLGYALRFPRFMGYREDKSAHDATSVVEIKKLYKNQFKK